MTNECVWAVTAEQEEAVASLALRALDAEPAVVIHLDDFGLSAQLFVQLCNAVVLAFLVSSIVDMSF